MISNNLREQGAVKLNDIFSSIDCPNHPGEMDGKKALAITGYKKRTINGIELFIMVDMEECCCEEMHKKMVEHLQANQIEIGKLMESHYFQGLES